MKNLDKISSLEIIDSGIEHIDKLKGKENIKTLKIVHCNIKDLEIIIYIKKS